jgi:hypothetical protein
MNISENLDWGLKSLDDSWLCRQNIGALSDQFTDGLSLLGEGSQMNYFFLAFLGLEQLLNEETE